MGSRFLDGFATDAVAEAAAPGVVRGRGFRGLDLSIEGFGIGDFRLAGGLVVDSVG